MKINYLEIKGFKSIQNVELKDVSPFMVLAGANGTGKSNFVDALAFLSKVIDIGVSKAVSEFGGVKNLIDPKQKNEIISYRINAEIEEQVYEYEIDILLSKSSLLPSLPTVPVSVKHEYLKIFKNGKTIFDSSEEARKLELKKKEEEMKKIQGEQTDIGWGNQIRSYVFQPYALVKDHRTNTEIGNVKAVMDGSIDDFINSYLRWIKNN